jgi:hypothetical protein
MIVTNRLAVMHDGGAPEPPQPMLPNPFSPFND